MNQKFNSLSLQELEELKKSVETIKNIFLKIKEAESE